MSVTIKGPDGKPRCSWCGAAPEFFHYHDTEWGFPVGDDIRLFEKLSLEGFQSGGDDYMTKPFDLEELLARVYVRLRTRPNAPVANANMVRIGEYSVDVFIRSMAPYNSLISSREPMIPTASGRCNSICFR